MHFTRVGHEPNAVTKNPHNSRGTDHQGTHSWSHTFHNPECSNGSGRLAMLLFQKSVQWYKCFPMTANETCQRPALTLPGSLLGGYLKAQRMLQEMRLQSFSR